MERLDWEPPAQLPFHFHVYEVADCLPPGWRKSLLQVAAEAAERRSFRPTMSTAREQADVEIPMESVNGSVLRARAPWLFDLYAGWFRELAQRLSPEELQLTSTDDRALSLNVQRGDGARYPCHVDSNPMQGLLYLTDVTAASGGGLAVSMDMAAKNVLEVDARSRVLHPRSGQLYLFDARRHPHYVQPVREADGLRVVLTMNYYSASCPETARPADLDDRLFTAAD